jgi:hypothetical protein
MKKFAPMGSAVTFPVQSLVFLLLTVYAVRLFDGKEGHLRGLKESFGEVTVFGDDIIAPSRAINAITWVLTQCGLKVNTEKTFSEGNFRESCGMDAFKGYDVTPAYILGQYDDSPSSMATTIEQSNNFHLRGLWRAADLIVSYIPQEERKRLYVANGMEDGPTHLRTFCNGDEPVHKMHWDRAYQRAYFTVLTVTSKVSKVRGSGNDCLTQYFTEAPDPELPWSAGQVGRVKLRKGLTRVYR